MLAIVRFSSQFWDQEFIEFFYVPYIVLSEHGNKVFRK